MHLQMGYPQMDKELEILENGTLRYDSIQPDPVITRNEVLRL